MAHGRKPRLSAELVVQPTEKTWKFSTPTICHTKVEDFLALAPERGLFDLIVTSPPYNIGKTYEPAQKELSRYLLQQKKVVKELVKRLKPTGSICWQVGNFVENGEIAPLDLEFHKMFRKLGLKLRNRIVWRFRHGLHNTRRFSGRYEVILWYTKSDKYTFNLDAVRVPSKYPGKKHYRGSKKGQYSGHPLGKNPSDVWDDFWDIPNVKGNHIEKTAHPCQFPVGLVERLILALTKENDVVFDPYAGVCSAGVAAVVHGRRFIGCEKLKKYTVLGRKRLDLAVAGRARYRHHDKPIYDHTKSKLSLMPPEFVEVAPGLGLHRTTPLC
ncbi:MAG: site-specific DNA-methyltransferase [Alphaproteobacteria bacterium]|nr:site-specific DNA-methyltransferase [Alphaproteobacteria bacterium]